MNVEPVLIVELLMSGCVSGFLAGLLGIGGGMLLVPALTFIASAQAAGQAAQACVCRFAVCGGCLHGEQGACRLGAYLTAFKRFTPATKRDSVSDSTPRGIVMSIS